VLAAHSIDPCSCTQTSVITPATMDGCNYKASTTHKLNCCTNTRQEIDNRWRPVRSLQMVAPTFIGTSRLELRSDKEVWKRATHDLQYLLEYWRERRSLGGLRQVYLNLGHHDLHKAFLGAHNAVGPRRMVLHDILHRLSSTAPPDPAPTTPDAQQQFAQPTSERVADQVAVDR
jgi:hypothetical protein